MYSHCTCQALWQKLICTQSKSAHISHRGAQKEKGNPNNALLQLLPGPNQDRWEPETRTQRRGTLPASLPGLALHSLSLRHGTHPGESALPLRLRYVAALAWDSLWGAGEGHLGITQDPVVSHTILAQRLSFLISFNDWAWDKMHEENSNEKKLRKKSPYYYYYSSPHTVNVPVHWCLALFWCHLS